MEIHKTSKKKEKKVNKEKKEQKKKLINEDENIVRQLSKYLNEAFNLNKLKGELYFNIHLYILFVIGFVTLFTSSINILIIVLIIVSLDAISIVFLHECPLTTMEKKYLGITSCEIRNNLLHNAGIMYKCDHNYEKQIELLINVWTMIATKCISIIFLQMFNIKLFDIGKIYI